MMMTVVDDWQLLRLDDGAGLKVEILTLGATVAGISLDGQQLTLQQPDLLLYRPNVGYLGSTIGRYANRIAKGQFQLAGATVQLECNTPPHHLHGGYSGLSGKVWQVLAADTQSVELYCESADGEGGFPGFLRVWQTLSVEQGQLVLTFRAVSDQDTILSLTNHCYFNLDGSADIAAHLLWLAADHFLPIDTLGIPTGEIKPVVGTAFDFSQPRLLAEALQQPDPQLLQASGFDHCFVRGDELWTETDGEARLMARLFSPASGVQLEVLSTLPGLQFYSGNFLSAPHQRRQALCLEAQYWPDAPNQPGFPSVVLGQGQPYQHKIIYKFNKI